MRSFHINFALAIAISLAVHVLLWPAAKHLRVPYFSVPGDSSNHRGEVTLVLSDSPKAVQKKLPLIPPPVEKVDPTAPKPVIRPKSPVVEPPDEIGEATGKGTGSHPAKGEKPLIAPDAEQDQPFLSRDPVGMGRVGDPPVFSTAPRGQDGSGGQRGGPQLAPNPPHLPSADPTVAKADNSSSDVLHLKPKPLPPRRSPVREDMQQKPSVTPIDDVAPPPKDQVSLGAAKADVKHPPVDETKARAGVAIAAAESPDAPRAAKLQGTPARYVAPSSTAPPTSASAPVDRAAVVMAPKLPVPQAAVATLPQPAVDAEAPKPMEKPTKEKPVMATVAPAPALVQTGDGRAPGHDRASADPAQESDSETDPFKKESTAVVLHDGSLEVRQGRKWILTRPHFLPGSMPAMIATENPTVVLKISIDEKGKPIHPEIVSSSGSDAIDQPIRVAAYDWWTEPTHNKAGKPVPDVLLFTVRIK